MKKPDENTSVLCGYIVSLKVSRTHKINYNQQGPTAKRLTSRDTNKPFEIL